MALPTRITLPPSARPVGGLLAAAGPIGGEWWRGVTFSSVQCTAPQAVAWCPDGGVTKDQQGPSAPTAFEMFGILQALECSTLGQTDVQALAEMSLDVTREYAVASELLTGAASSNPSLADAANLGAAGDAVAALGCLEQVASVSLSGRLVFFHASPAVATALLSAHAVWKDGRLWRTALGNVVVVSPGYDGRSPGGSAPANGDSMWLYATGQVYAETGNRETLSSIERSQNTTQAWSEEAALVIFDPCFVAAVDTGVSFCDLIS